MNSEWSNLYFIINFLFLNIKVLCHGSIIELRYRYIVFSLEKKNRKKNFRYDKDKLYGLLKTVERIHYIQQNYRCIRSFGTTHITLTLSCWNCSLKKKKKKTKKAVTKAKSCNLIPFFVIIKLQLPILSQISLLIFFFLFYIFAFTTFFFVLDIERIAYKNKMFDIIFRQSSKNNIAHNGFRCLVK